MTLTTRDRLRRAAAVLLPRTAYDRLARAALATEDRARDTRHALVGPVSRRRHQILVLGDSHSKVFKRRIFRDWLVGFDLVAVTGGTVSGLSNPSSSSGAASAFDIALSRWHKRDTGPRAIFTMLGEVDCGFVMWWHHERDGTPLAELLQRALNNYEKLLMRTTELAPTVVVSAPLPTIRDGAPIPSELHLRTQVKATLRERTNLVCDFNRGLKAVAAAVGSTFIDLDSVSLGADGLVSPLLLDSDPLEHHYDRDTYAAVLKKAIEQQAPTVVGRPRRPGMVGAR